MASVHIIKEKPNHYSVNGQKVKLIKDKIVNLHMLDFTEEQALRDFIQKEKHGIKIQSSIC
jgi:hypothetical protein